MTPLVVAVVGPTATGKSDLGVALAERLGGEVVNADAMQLYRGMDIGTAKLTSPQRHGVPHHQLDVLDVGQDSTVASYQRHARDDVAQVRARGARAVVVGGSGLYVRALLDRLEIPPTDPEVRRRLEERADVEGPGLLHDALAVVDPLAAERVGLVGQRRAVGPAGELDHLEGTHQPAGVRPADALRSERVDGREGVMQQAGPLDVGSLLQAAPDVRCLLYTSDAADE